MDDSNDIVDKATTKTDRLRAAYDVFQRKMQGLREERLHFMKAKFKELDEQKLARLMKEIKSMALAQERSLDAKDIAREQSARLEVPKNIDAPAMAEAVRATAGGEVSGFFSGTEKGMKNLQEAGSGDNVRQFMEDFGTRAAAFLHELEDSINAISDGPEQADGDDLARRELENADTIRPPLERRPDGINPYGDTIPASDNAAHEQNARKYLSSVPAIPRASRVPKFDLPAEDDQDQQKTV